MIDKQDVIVSLLKEIDKNIENLGGSETDVLLSNRITTLENSVKTINTDINGIKTTNTTQTANITSNTNKITDITNELSTVKSNVSTNTSNIGVLTTEVNTLKDASATKTSLNNTNTNVSNLTTRVTDVENKATTNESNLNTLNERVTTLENAEPSGSENDTTSGGYPIIATEANTIFANANTFYDIKSEGCTIVLNPYQYSTERKFVTFTGDYSVTDESFQQIFQIFEQGGAIVSSTNDSTYKYKYDIGNSMVTLYGTDDIIEGGTTTIIAEQSGQRVEMGTISNIKLLENNKYMWLIDSPFGLVSATVGEEIENDNPDYNHKYTVCGAASLLADTIYTIEEIDKTDTIWVMGIGALISLNISKVSTKLENTCEYIFNIKSPNTIEFTEEIKWHNDNIPDFTKEGIYTISILNGIGCYTFVND